MAVQTGSGDFAAKQALEALRQELKWDIAATKANRDASGDHVLLSDRAHDFAVLDKHSVG
jgi:hypothetical protein